MTVLEVVFVYRPPVGGHELAAVNSMSDVRRIRLMKFNQQINTVIIECDESRLSQRDLAFMLRNACIGFTTSPKVA